jgi:hypothetical protein
MAYFRVLMKQTDTFEVLVSAKDAGSARAKVNEVEWGEPIDTDIYEYEVHILEVKNAG